MNDQTGRGERERLLQRNASKADVSSVSRNKVRGWPVAVIWAHITSQAAGALEWLTTTGAEQSRSCSVAQLHGHHAATAFRLQVQPASSMHVRAWVRGGLDRPGCGNGPNRPVSLLRTAACRVCQSVAVRSFPTALRSPITRAGAGKRRSHTAHSVSAVRVRHPRPKPPAVCYNLAAFKITPHHTTPSPRKCTHLYLVAFLQSGQCRVVHRLEERT